MKKMVLMAAISVMAHAAFGQQIELNGDFEDTIVITTQTSTYTAPEHWNWSGYGSGFTSDAVSGIKAMVINNWYYYGKGYLSNGDPSIPYSNGASIDFRPSALTGHYKYIIGDVVSVNDSAVATVFLTKFNTVSGQRDTLGRGIMKFPAQDTYLPFQVDINYISSEQPDSVFIKFQSSQTGFCSNESDGNCLYFYVDDVALINETAGINNSVELFTASVFPNPGSDQIVLNNPGSQPMIAELVSADSRSIAFYSVNSNSSNVIDCSGFPTGVYFFRIDNGRSVIRWIKE